MSTNAPRIGQKSVSKQSTVGVPVPADGFDYVLYVDAAGKSYRVVVADDPYYTTKVISSQ